MTTSLLTKAEQLAGRRKGTLLTIREVADMLSVHPNTVRIWGKLGLLPVYRIGPRGDRRFKIKDVEDFLQRNRQGPLQT